MRHSRYLLEIPWPRRSEQVDVDAGQFGGAPPAALVPPSVRIVHRTTYDILADLGFDLKRGNGRADAHARSVGDLAIAGIVGMHQQRRLFRANKPLDIVHRSEEHTSELQSLMRISYAVLCSQKK